MMHASCIMNLGMAYFNMKHSVWEPLIEPVETSTTSYKPSYKPWSVIVEMKQNESVEESKRVANKTLLPLTSVKIMSENILEMTVSSAVLEMIGELTKSLEEE